MATRTETEHILVNPVTSPQVPPFQYAPRLESLSGKRVGLIDDSKENAKELLQELAAVLQERYGVTETLYHAKPSASKPAEPDEIASMADNCDFVIVAIGS